MGSGRGGIETGATNSSGSEAADALRETFVPSCVSVWVKCVPSRNDTAEDLYFNYTFSCILSVYLIIVMLF